jgi:hypothetical protein
MTAASAASDALTLALLGLAATGERTHCSDPTSHHLWLSEHDTERAIAITLCDHCPVPRRNLGRVGWQGLQPQTWTCKRLKQAGSDDDLFSVA